MVCDAFRRPAGQKNNCRRAAIWADRCPENPYSAAREPRQGRASRGPRATKRGNLGLSGFAGAAWPGPRILTTETILGLLAPSGGDLGLSVECRGGNLSFVQKCCFFAGENYCKNVASYVGVFLRNFAARNRAISAPEIAHDVISGAENVHDAISGAEIVHDASSGAENATKKCFSFSF